MATIWVKPQAGARLRDYRTKQLWADGVAVEIPAYDLVFGQLINHGDLVECEAPEPEPEPADDAGESAAAEESKPEGDEPAHDAEQA